MNRYYYSEMEDIYQSYEYSIRERLEALDHLSRKMFTDMSLARVKHPVAMEYVGRKLTELIAEIVEKGDASDCGKRSTWAKFDKV
jgi:hypothetical protein